MAVALRAGAMVVLPAAISLFAVGKAGFGHPVRAAVGAAQVGTIDALPPLSLLACWNFTIYFTTPARAGNAIIFDPRDNRKNPQEVGGAVMEEGTELSLREGLASGPDPRHPPGRRHPLTAILALAVCAMLGDCRSWYAIAPWGREHPELTQAQGFTRAQTPCVATWHHVFRPLKVAAFAAALTPGARAAAPDKMSVLAGDVR